MNNVPQGSNKAQLVKLKHEHIVSAIDELQRVEERIVSLLEVINKTPGERIATAKAMQSELCNLNQVLSETPRLIYDSVAHIESVLRQIEISLFGEN